VFRDLVVDGSDVTNYTVERREVEVEQTLEAFLGLRKGVTVFGIIYESQFSNTSNRVWRVLPGSLGSGPPPESPG